MEDTKLLKVILLMLVFVFLVKPSFSQGENPINFSFTKEEKQVQPWKHSIGSSLFLIGNLDTEEPPLYFQLNYGYQFTPKDILVVEAITWAYYDPLGVQWWGSSEDKYPGKIRSFGIGLGYKHFYWKNLYSTVQVTPFLQSFIDSDDKKIQSGLQLWCQLRTGYRFEFFGNRWFLEPSFVCNYWPVNTNFPESFKKIENKWPNYFLFEPGLHFGFKF